MNFLDNELKIYFGDDCVINKNITLHHPRIGDIVEIGEDEYFSVVHTLTAIPSDMKPQLWDLGICWEDISDFDLFCMLVSSKCLDIEKTKVFFGDIDFNKFELCHNHNNGKNELCQIVNDRLICIDERAYLWIAEILRKIHGIVPKVERAGSNTVRKILIEEDRKKLRYIKDEKHGSTLLPMISSLLNCSEFKYDLEGIRKLPVYTFMDSVVRIPTIKSSTALLQGCYSGMIDTHKIDKKELNWMRDLSKGA